MVASRAETTAARWVLIAALIAGCSFKLDSHPKSCATESDCASGYTCYDSFCVAESGPSISGPMGGAGGSTSTRDSSAPPMSGSGGDGGGSAQDDAGMSASDAGTAPTDSGGGGSSDSGGPDAAPVDDAGTPIDSGMTPAVPPYSDCNGDGDCNADEICRINGSRGVCAAPCSAVGDCPDLSGNHTATPICGTDGRCRMNCAPSPPVPPFPRTCPTGLSCVGEVGAQTCYPQ